MECKFNLLNNVPISKCELIDTLWNVNAGMAILAPKLTLELIDTLWNVNYLDPLICVI